MSKDITAEVRGASMVTIEFAAGPLIMFWALQRLRNTTKVADFSGGNNDNVLDSVVIDPGTLVPGETFPYSMAILAPSADVQYNATVRVVQNGATLAHAPFAGSLDANKAINCAGMITLVKKP